MAKITMREAISQALWEEMERDERVFILGEEVGVWGGTYAVTKGFYDHFGEKRVRDTPIAEAAIIGAAIGSAMTGLRPVAEMMTINFAFSAFDHIVNEAAKLHYMFGGQFVRAAGHPRTGWRRAAVGRHPLADTGCDLRPFPRIESGRSGHSGRRQGLAQICHPFG